LEDSANQVLVLPRKSTEQNGSVGALVGREGPLYWTMKVLGLIEP
jgi:hypothetical protein